MRLKEVGVEFIQLATHRVAAPLVHEANEIIWRANRPISLLNQKIIKAAHRWKTQQKKEKQAEKLIDESLARMEGEGPIPSGELHDQAS